MPGEALGAVPLRGASPGGCSAGLRPGLRSLEVGDEMRRPDLGQGQGDLVWALPHGEVLGVRGAAGNAHPR